MGAANAMNQHCRRFMDGETVVDVGCTGCVRGNMDLPFGLGAKK
jgi:hypothetical protein